MASPYNEVNGRRQTAANAYLDPARGRPNLTILPETTATRLVLDGLRVPYGPLISPASPDDWQEHVTTSYITYNHAVGTCRMGPAEDLLAVVSPELRVHGLDNLWIADASIIPVVPHAPTNLSALMIGEIAARDLRSV
jgi:choline dehydrogenase-like flavoprotein